MLKWLLIGGGITGAGVAGFLGYRKWSSSEQKRIDTLIAQLVQEQAEEGNKPEGWTPPVKARPQRVKQPGQVARYRAGLAPAEGLSELALALAEEKSAELPEQLPLLPGSLAWLEGNVPPAPRGRVIDIRPGRRVEVLPDFRRERALAAMVAVEPSPLPALDQAALRAALHRKHPVQLCACDVDNCVHGQVQVKKA